MRCRTEIQADSSTTLECQVEHLDPDHPVRLHCRGQVVRVEPVDGHTGVAVAITVYRVATPE